MHEGTSRRKARERNARRRPRGSGGIGSRPDRVALWAVIIAVVAMVAAAASARGSTGGVGGGESTGEKSGCAKADFGKRSLRLGDCGNDVKTLNWVLKSKDLGNGLKANKRFRRPTDGAVRAFQRRKDLKVDGVADRRTRKKLINTMSRDRASWYGPGLWGNLLACGGRLTTSTVGVAHLTLPCGTKVVLRKGKKFLRTRVIDRGPYVAGRQWDLTEKAARKLGMAHTATVYSVVVR